MTLIIGIKCSNGIVVGSDGAATLSSFGQVTATQPTPKLDVFDNRVIVGVSGPVGLGQIIKGTVEKLWKDGKFSGKPLHDSMTILRTQVWDCCVRKEVEVAAVMQNLTGNIARNCALCHTLVAMPISKQLQLVHLDENGAPETATDGLPFIAIGSGQLVADPFLAYLRRLFWEDRIPNLAEGIFSTWWALDYAIKSAPGVGLSEPKQIAVIERDGGEFKAHILTKQELEENEEVVHRAERHVKGFQTTTPPATETPKIPEPPKAT